MLVFEYLNSLLTRLLLKSIRFYQQTLSPDSGVFKHRYPFGYCRFTPTCSEYSYQAIAKYGPLRGIFKATIRIMRCHPWSKGGYDPLL